MRYCFIILVLLLFGCENELIHSDEDYQPYIIANSVVSADSTWYVKLTYSKSIWDQGDIKPVENATVKISVLDDDNSVNHSIQEFFLDYDGNGEYTRGNNPTAGNTYLMTITTEDHVVTAQTYVPKVLSLLNVQILDNETIDGENSNENRSSVVDLEISVNNQNEDHNYYAWDIVPVLVAGPVTQVDPIDEHPAGDNTTDKETDVEDDPEVEENNLDFQRNNNLPVHTISSDNDGVITLEDVLADINEDPATNTSSPDGTTESNGILKYKLRVWAISSDYYQYLTTIQQNSLGSSDAVPVTPYSNVVDGGGIFAGYNLEEEYIQL